MYRGMLLETVKPQAHKIASLDNLLLNLEKVK